MKKPRAISFPQTVWAHGGPWDEKKIVSKYPGGTHIFTCKGMTGHYDRNGQWRTQS